MCLLTDNCFGLGSDSSVQPKYSIANQLLVTAAPQCRGGADVNILRLKLCMLENLI